MNLANIYTALNVKTTFSGYFIQLIFSNESWLSTKAVEKQLKIETVEFLLGTALKVIMKYKGSEVFDKISLPFYVSVWKLFKRLSDKT